MNRGEYANSIRDLLGVEVDAATLLPADDSSNGFDNIADVLGVSPGAARTLCDRGRQNQPSRGGRSGHGSARRHLHGQGRSHADGQLSTACRWERAAGSSSTHNFPLDGEYLIKLSLTKLSFGQVFGEGAEGQEFEVTIDGQRVKLYKLDEAAMFFMREIPAIRLPSHRWPIRLEERVKMTPDIHMEFRLNVKAGPQTIGVAFLQKSYAAIEDLVHRPVASTKDSNIGMQYGYTAVPHLARVDITGPYNAKGPGDTPSRQRDLRVPPKRGRGRDPLRAPHPLQHWCAGHSAVLPRTRISNRCSASINRRATRGNFDTGIEMALRRILADPEFVFRFEPPSGQRCPGPAVSHQRHGTGLAPVVLFVVQHSRR